MDLQIILVLSLVLCSVTLVVGETEEEEDEDDPIIDDDVVGQDTDYIVEKYGYHWELHKVTSETGYITAIHRIPHGKNNTNATKGPIFLMHGLLQSSVDWLLVSNERALPFLLVDKGYDVWLGNARGTKSSLFHTTLDSEDVDYWKFSFHEMGNEDLPVTFDYILKTTGARELAYVGFSLGTAMFYVCLSTRPEYNDKISKMVALASVGALKTTRMTAGQLKHFPDTLMITMTDLFNHGRIFPFNKFLETLFLIPCRLKLAIIFCKGYSHAFFGYDPPEYNKTTMARFTGLTAPNTAMRIFVHIVQGVRSSSFQQFDHGAALNLEKYGQETPPDYPLHDITVPVFGLCGHGDTMTTFQDCSDTLYSLGNLVNTLNIAVKDDSWHHFDFVLGDKVKPLVYDRAIAFFEAQIFKQKGVFG